MQVLFQGYLARCGNNKLRVWGCSMRLGLVAALKLVKHPTAWRRKGVCHVLTHLRSATGSPGCV